MPTIDLTDDEHAAVTATNRRTIQQDRFPHAPRLDPLRSALEKLIRRPYGGPRRRKSAEAGVPQSPEPPGARASCAILHSAS
jgi:hypothetical protein